MSNCEAVRDVAFNAKEYATDYRLTIILFCFGLINILSKHVQTRVVAKFSAYEHLSPEANEELSVRCLQLGFGALIGVTGYSFLLYNATTGCNANEIYLFFIGGMWLVALDAHEFVRRWPLRVPVLAHHLTVFLVGLAFLEWNVLPPEEDDPVHWTIVLLISNIGLVWTTDFFHVVYRTSSSLTIIENFRVVYLYLAVIRLVNVGLFGALAARSARANSYLGLTTTALLGLAYIYNTYRAVIFVKNFQCAKYFMAHQVEWSNALPQTPEETAPSSMKEDSSEMIDQSTTPPYARIERASFVRRPSSLTQSLSLRSLGISMESKRSRTQVGLRGDIALYDDLKEFVEVD
jgi:hypothetical protein